MKKITILFAALAALVSCNKENPVTPETPSQETYSVTLTAVAPTAGGDTKTTLVDGGNFVHWSKGDAIKVMFAAQVMKDELMNGSDEFESDGQVLTSYFEEETANEANFKIDAFTLNAANKKYYIQTGIALYPSSAYAKSSKRAYNNPTTTVYYSLPNEQTAVKDNIESNLNFAYADVDIYEFTSGSVPELQFKNACSLIKLTMPQSFNDKNVVSVTIESNDDSYLSGKGTVDFAKFPGEFKVSVAGDSKNPGVTLVSETGFEAGASYYAVVWPGEHSGLTFTFTADDGATATVTTSKAVNLQASHVKPYTFNSTLQFEEAESWVYYAPGEGTGKYYYDNGTVGDNPAPTDRKILGVVFYNGNPRDGKDTALPVHCTHGLALSLNFTGGVRFHAKISVSGWPSNTGLHGLGTLYGYSAMTAWKDAGEYASMTLYNTNYGDIDASKTSGWYHATDKEWDVIASNIGALNASLEECGAAKIPESNVNCWVPILGSTLKRGMYVFSCKSTGVSYDSYLVSNTLNARPIFAF